jgi:hypothetical protein
LALSDNIFDSPFRAFAGEAEFHETNSPCVAINQSVPLSTDRRRDFPIHSGYLLFFALALLIINRQDGLYVPLQAQGSLHEQRKTIQACFGAGLLLCGGLYMVHDTIVSRGFVAYLIALTTTFLCVLREFWLQFLYRKYVRVLTQKRVDRGHLPHGPIVVATACTCLLLSFKCENRKKVYGIHQCAKPLLNPLNLTGANGYIVQPFWQTYCRIGRWEFPLERLSAPLSTSHSTNYPFFRLPFHLSNATLKD